MPRKILIIDGQPSVAQRLREALEKHGHEIHVYTKEEGERMDVEEALRQTVEFGPDDILCAARWDEDLAVLDAPGWRYANRLPDIPGSYRLIVTSKVSEDQVPRYNRQARDCGAEFVAKARLLRDPQAVIEPPPIAA